MLLDTNSDKYLNRLAKMLRLMDSIYDSKGRIYAHEGIRVVNGQLYTGVSRVIDHNHLWDGNGNAIVASRSTR